MSKIPFRKFTKSDLYGSFAVVVIGACFLWLILGNLVFHLNDVSFASGGDGVKSYYSSLYHIQHDESMTHFEGMNYPFGEHIFYTDCQPLLTTIIKFTKDTFFDISSKTLGILNLMILLSFVFGSLFIYLILRKLNINHLVSIVASLIIIWLSPQIHRLTGHFALAYLSHIPGIIWFTMRFYEKQNLKASLWLMIWGVFVSLTHFYFFGLFALLLILFWSNAFITKSFLNLSNAKKLLHISIQIIIPLLLVQGYLMITDNVPDRPGTPWGFMHYRAFPESVFLPFDKPYGVWLNNVFDSTYITWEGRNYLGAALTLFTFFIFFRTLFMIILGRWRKALRIFEQRWLNLLFWASMASLMYSFAIPFVFKLEWLLKYLGPIKQMRGVGRFSWLFYVGGFIVMVKATDLWLSTKKPLLKYSVIGLILVVSGYEAYINTKEKNNQLNNDFPKYTVNDKVSENVDDYQAIILLPYFHIGSENIWWEDKGGLLGPGISYSLQTGLPLTDVIMSRTSLSQTWGQLTPFLEHQGTPAIFDRYNNKDLLIMVSNDSTLLKPIERRIVRSADYITHDDGVSIYSISVASYKKVIASNEVDFNNLIASQVSKAKWVIHGDDIENLEVSKHARIFDVDVPDSISNITVLFYTDNVKDDLYSRIALGVYTKNEDGTYNSFDYLSFGHKIYALYQNRGIIKLDVQMAEGIHKFELTVLGQAEMRKGSINIKDPVIINSD